MVLIFFWATSLGLHTCYMVATCFGPIFHYELFERSLKSRLGCHELRRGTEILGLVKQLIILNIIFEGFSHSFMKLRIYP